MSDYFLYLSFNNNAEGFQIPVNPESIQVDKGGNGKTYDILGSGGGTDETRPGEVNVIKSPKLKEVSFSSIFPSQVYPFVVTDILFDPMFYIKLIEKWMATKHPIRFIFAGFHNSFSFERSGMNDGDINMPASIEKFTWKEVAGAPGDIEYTISLKEYVFYSARRVVVKTDSNGNQSAVQMSARRPDERIRPSTYTLRKNEGLTHVSMRFFSTSDGMPDSSRAMDIQKLNRLTDTQAQKLKEGDVVKIPAY